MDIKINLSAAKAVELFNVISLLTGSASHQLLRKGIQDNIVKLWPEIADKDSDIDTNQERSLELSSRELRSLAEGFFSFLNKKNQMGEVITTGTDFNFILNLSKTVKVSGWLQTKIEQEPEIPDFEGDIDGEPALIPDQE